MATFPSYSVEKNFALSTSETLHKLLSLHKFYPCVADKIKEIAAPLESYRKDQPTDQAKFIVNCFAADYLKSSASVSTFVKTFVVSKIRDKLWRIYGSRLCFAPDEDYKKVDRRLSLLVPNKSIAYPSPYKLHKFVWRSSAGVKTVNSIVILKEPSSSDIENFHSKFWDKNIDDYSFVFEPCGTSSADKYVWLPKKELFDDIYYLTAGDRLHFIYLIDGVAESDSFRDIACQVFAHNPSWCEYLFCQIQHSCSKQILDHIRSDIYRYSNRHLSRNKKGGE